MMFSVCQGNSATILEVTRRWGVAKFGQETNDEKLSFRYINSPSVPSMSKTCSVNCWESIGTRGTGAKNGNTAPSDQMEVVGKECVIALRAEFKAREFPSRAGDHAAAVNTTKLLCH